MTDDLREYAGRPNRAYEVSGRCMVCHLPPERTYGGMAQCANRHRWSDSGTRTLTAECAGCGGKFAMTDVQARVWAGYAAWDAEHRYDGSSVTQVAVIRTSNSDDSGVQS